MNSRKEKNKEIVKQFFGSSPKTELFFKKSWFSVNTKSIYSFFDTWSCVDPWPLTLSTLFFYTNLDFVWGWVVLDFSELWGWRVVKFETVLRMFELWGWNVLSFQFWLEFNVLWSAKCFLTFPRWKSRGDLVLFQNPNQLKHIIKNVS